MQRRDNRLRAPVGLTMPRGSFPGPGCWLSPITLTRDEPEVAIVVVEERTEARSKWREPFGVEAMTLGGAGTGVVALYVGVYAANDVLVEKEFIASGRRDPLAKMFVVAERQTHLHVVGLDETLTSFALVEVLNRMFNGMLAGVSALPDREPNLNDVLRWQKRVSFEAVCVRLRQEHRDRLTD